jgi:ribosomal-protein-alanine N-acetyltransferase
MEMRDVDVVAALEARAFSTPSRADTFRTLLERPGAEMHVLELGEDVAGYAVLWCILDQGELANIAIREDERGRGLGRLLLDHMIGIAHERGVRSLFLEVRMSNRAAARLYASRGFAEIGRRENYYERPREDARVLQKRL